MKEVIFKNEGVVDDTVSLALWLEAIRQADLMKNLDRSVVGCTKDKDSECRRRSCINNQIAAPIFSRVRLLKLKEKALNWLKKHPNFRPEIENLREFLPVASLSELEDEIKKIEYASEVNEVKEVFKEVTSSFIDSKRTEVAMVDVFEDINTYSCPREITVNVSKLDELGEKTGYVVVDQFNKVRIIRNILLDWDYAKNNQEIIKKIQEESWAKLLSEKEVLKRGIKPATIGKCKKRN